MTPEENMQGPLVPIHQRLDRLEAYCLLALLTNMGNLLSWWFR